MQLNPQQIEAVHHTDGPLLILAGAGSGKTRVITQRIAWLVREKKVLPKNILAVTFTNKAADEMRHRVERLLGTSPRDLWISTFHSFCVRILRRTRPDFAIYDEDDSRTLIRRCLEEMQISERALPPRAVSARIASAKNNLLGPEALAARAPHFFEKRIAEVYRLYQKKLEANNACDFGDLIFKTVTLFQKEPSVLSFYQDLFRYILIDEYQDTNRAQYVLTGLLAGRHKNLCVVGDDDQSIYRWRGADIGNILNFEADYPGCRVIRLEQNYRSTGNVLKLASDLIAHNKGRKGKTLWTEGVAGEKAVLFVAEDEKEEARFVIDRIEREVRSGKRRYNDFALLYRTNAQSRAFEDELRRRRIACLIFGGVSFYDRKEVKDVLAYLKVLINPEDSLNLKRILNVPARGLGSKVEERLDRFAAEKRISLREAIARSDEIVDLASAARKRIREFHKLMEGLGKEARKVTTLLTRIIEKTGYGKMLRKEGTFESEGRLENLEELLNVAHDFEKETTEPTPALFLDRVSLAGDTDFFDPEKGAVPMMTLHLAKGLEFPVVFIVGMEEGLFPHSRSLREEENGDTSGALEEERRLCYVALTRAKEQVILTLAQQRQLHGVYRYNFPSRFLEEMPENLITRHDR